MLGLSPEYLEIERVNRWINTNTVYRTDIDLYNTPEFWEAANGQGDCEDYALAKRRMLIGSDAAWADRLRIAVVFTETNEGQRLRESKRTLLEAGLDYFTGDHAILIASTPEGDYALDNRYPDPMELFATGYTIDRIQIAGTTEWEHGKDNGTLIPLTATHR